MPYGRHRHRRKLLDEASKRRTLSTATGRIRGKGTRYFCCVFRRGETYACAG